MQIWVPTLNIKLDVNATDTVENVKIKLKEYHNISVEKQQLFFSGKELDNDKMLKDYNIKDRSRITLVINDKKEYFWEQYCQNPNENVEKIKKIGKELKNFVPQNSANDYCKLFENIKQLNNKHFEKTKTDLLEQGKCVNHPQTFFSSYNLDDVNAEEFVSFKNENEQTIYCDEVDEMANYLTNKRKNPVSRNVWIDPKDVDEIFRRQNLFARTPKSSLKQAIIDSAQIAFFSDDEKSVLNFVRLDWVDFGSFKDLCFNSNIITQRSVRRIDTQPNLSLKKLKLCEEIINIKRAKPAENLAQFCASVSNIVENAFEFVNARQLLDCEIENFRGFENYLDDDDDNKRSLYFKFFSTIVGNCNVSILMNIDQWHGYDNDELCKAEIDFYTEQLMQKEYFSLPNFLLNNADVRILIVNILRPNGPSIQTATTDEEHSIVAMALLNNCFIGSFNQQIHDASRSQFNIFIKKLLGIGLIYPPEIETLDLQNKLFNEQKAGVIKILRQKSSQILSQVRRIRYYLSNSPLPDGVSLVWRFLALNQFAFFMEESNDDNKKDKAVQMMPRNFINVFQLFSDLTISNDYSCYVFDILSNVIDKVIEEPLTCLPYLDKQQVDIFYDMIRINYDAIVTVENIEDIESESGLRARGIAVFLTNNLFNFDIWVGFFKRTRRNERRVSV